MRLLILLFLSLPLFAQGDRLLTDLEQTADDLYEGLAGAAPGAYVLVYRDGEVIFQRTYGRANIELGVPVSDSTVFDFASLAKMFTGYAIATLVERGELDLSDPVHRHLPRFRDYGAPLTVGHLLHHTSGVRNWTELLPLAGWNFEDRITTEHILEAVYAQKKLRNAPGEEYRYSNSGYNLLVAIIEKVTGQPFVDWTQEHVFRPLGMDRTFFHDDKRRSIPNLATGYRYDNGRDLPEIDNLYAPGSSSLFGTAPDLGKWIAFLLDPPADKRAIVRRMRETAPLNDGGPNDYAYGIQVEEYRTHPLIGHSGSWAGFTSYLALLPDQRTGVLLSHNFRTNTRSKLEAFVNVLLPASAPPVERAANKRPHADDFPAIPVPATTLDKYVGTYKLGPGWYLEVSREADQLFVQASGEPMFYTKIISDTSIIVPNYGHRTITFLTNGSGEVDALFYDGERRPRGKGVFPFIREEMKAYAGTYLSEELGLVFQLSVGEAALEAHHIKIGTIPLSKTDGGVLIGSGLLRRIKFAEEGQQSGFHVINSRGVERWFFRRVK